MKGQKRGDDPADLPAAIITADPGSADLARREVERVSPGARVLADLGQGALLLSLPGSYAALATTWRRSPPIFVRHLNPVQQILALPAGIEAIDDLRLAALEHLAARLSPASPFSIQARLLAAVSYGPYDVNTALAEVLAARSGAPLDVRHPQQVVSVIVAEYRGRVTGFLGLSSVADNLSAWPAGRVVLPARRAR